MTSLTTRLSTANLAQEGGKSIPVMFSSSSPLDNPAVNVLVEE